MGLGLGAPFFFLLLLLLLAAGSGAVPQDKRVRRNYVVLDLNTIEIHPNDKEEITSSKIHVSVESGTTVCSTCENLTNKSVESGTTVCSTCENLTNKSVESGTTVCSTCENLTNKSVESGTTVCSTCENLTNKSVSYLIEKQTQDEIMEILHGACSQTFSLEQKCLEMVDSYATLLFAKITEIKPDEFCKQYGLCRDVSFLSLAKSESTCAFCHHLIDVVLSKMKDPDSQFEILQLLMKECNKVQGHVQECKRMVLEYVPLILVNGEKFLEKKEVCTLMQACDASKKRTVGPFFDAGLRSDA